LGYKGKLLGYEGKFLGYEVRDVALNADWVVASATLSQRDVSRSRAERSRSPARCAIAYPLPRRIEKPMPILKTAVASCRFQSGGDGGDCGPGITAANRGNSTSINFFTQFCSADRIRITTIYLIVFTYFDPFY
jgi:hypothetical protein